MSDADNHVIIKKLKRQQEMLNHSVENLEKRIDDIIWYQKVGDVALIDKFRITGPPPRTPESVRKIDSGLINPLEARNPIVFWTYTFIPKNINKNKKYPLLVFCHSGIHSNMDSSYSHIISELIKQGYVIVAPEYRGSSGYGEMFYRLIDYGGLENEDAYIARNWMMENCDLIDPKRVGILGWSHGGQVALMSIFLHPEAYQVAFAGVPVCDVVSRMGYWHDDYRSLFSAPYHIGKTAYEDVDEYKRRSPAWNAEKLQTPLLVHTTTSDESVNVLEVEHLITALKAAEKKFEYKIYKDAPGGHFFDRIDNKLAREARSEIYRFLAKYLHPLNPIESL